MQTFFCRCFVLLVLLTWTPTLWAANLERSTTLPAAPAVRTTQPPVANNPTLQPANSGRGTLQKGAADLLIQSAQWSTPPAAGQQLGRNSILTIYLRNSGNVPAPATQLKVSCKALAGGHCPAGLDSTLNVPSIGMNQAFGMAWPSMSSSVWTAGKYRLVLSLDPRNQIPESNELNNKLTLNVDITTPLHAISGFQKNPQLEAAPRQGMTSAEFKALPDDARIGRFTKRQFIQAVEKAKSHALSKDAANSSKTRSTVKRLQLDYQQKMKANVDAGNQMLLSSMQSAVSASKNVKPQPSAGLSVAASEQDIQSTLPAISEVVPATIDGKTAATPGGWIAIKGDNLGGFCANNTGKILLKGNFPGGSVTLIPNGDYPCTGHAVMATVPDIEGVFDQQTRLVLQISNLTLEASSPIEFIARRVIENVEPGVGFVQECSENASFANACLAEAYGFGHLFFVAVHVNLPGSPATQGIDSFHYNFANGWKLFNAESAFESNPNYSCSRTSDNVATLSWSRPVQTEPPGDSLACYPTAIGPAGVPMK